MIGTDKFVKMNIQLQSLQDGSAKSEFLGGKNIVVVGDLHQLAPVGDKYITEKSLLDHRPNCAPSYWDEYFRIFHLTEKMRCSADAQFASICDRVGEGSITKEDEEFFKSRIQECEMEHENENFKDGSIAIVVTTNKDREKINLEKLEQLLPNQKTYVCHSEDTTLNVSNVAPLSKDLPITITGALPGELRIKVGAPVIITCNHKTKKWKEDGLTNGQRGYVEYVEVDEKNEEEVKIIWVVFHDREAGAKYRAAPEHWKLRRDQNLSEFATPILPTKRSFRIKSGHIQYQRKAFSLTLAYCITVHKVQGLTLKFVIVQFKDGYICIGSFYVAITRVRSGENLYLRDFDPSYIKFSKEVNDKVKQMQIEKPYQFFKLFLQEKCFKLDENDWKAGYLNINSMKDALHAEYVNADRNLLHLNLLCISDTRLSKEDTNESIQNILSNWIILFRQDSGDNRKHMGLLILAPKHSWTGKEDIDFVTYAEIKTRKKETTVQVMSVSHLDETISFIYCNITPSMKDIEEVQEITEQSDFMLGDINLDPENLDQRKKLEVLCGKDKMMHLRSVTRGRKNQLDHVIVKKELKHIVHSDSYHNFVSDHKTVVLRQSHYANDEVVYDSASKEMEEKKIDNLEIKIKSKQGKSTRKDESLDKELLLIKKTKKRERKVDTNTSEQLPRFWRMNGRNWLDDDIVNEFSNILMKKYPDIYIYPTFFNLSFFTLKRGYQQVMKFDKCEDSFSKRLVMFPMLEHCHWFLCVHQPNENILYILDPYGKENSVDKILEKHTTLLSKLEEEFLKPHYEKKKSKDLQDLFKTVVLPPLIPTQEDGYNCGVFMLEFQRYTKNNI